MKRHYHILFISPVILLLFTPYAVSQEIMSGVNMAKTFWFFGVSPLVIIVSSFLFAFKKKPEVRLHWPDLFILLFYLYTIGHIFFTDPSKFHLDKFAVQTLWVVLYFILKAFWGSANRRSGKYFEVFSIGVMLSAGGQAVIGLLQLYGFRPSLNQQFQITGTFVNPAPFSFFLGAVFPFALAVYFRYREKLKTIDIAKYFSLPFLPKLKISLDHIIYYISIATLFLILLVLPVTLIRTGWLMAIAGSVVVLYHQYKPEINKAPVQKWIRFMAIPILVVTMVVTIYGAYVLKKDSADGRALIWEIAVDKVKESPIFGQGYNAFYSQYNNWQADWFAAHPEEKEGPKGMLAGNVKFAYNEFLEIAVELGLVGIVLFVLFLAGAIKYGQERKKGTPITGSQTAVFSSIVALLAGSWFSYPLFSLPTFVLLLLFISIAVSYHEPWKTVKLNIPTQYSIMIIGLLLSTLFIKNKTKEYKAYREWKYADYFLVTNSLPVAIKTYEELYPVLKTEGLFLQQYGKVLSLNCNYQESVDILNLAIAYSSDTYLYTTLGDNYKALNQKEEAIKVYQRAMDIAPHKFYAPYLLAKLHFETGDTIAAVQLAKELLEKPIKVHSTAIEEIKQEMQDILTVADPEKTSPERAKPSAIRKDTGGKDDV